MTDYIDGVEDGVVGLVIHDLPALPDEHDDGEDEMEEEDAPDA